MKFLQKLCRKDRKQVFVTATLMSETHGTSAHAFPMLFLQSASDATYEYLFRRDKLFDGDRLERDKFD